MTNLDYIKEMSPREMAEFIGCGECNCCDYQNGDSCKQNNCFDGIEKWLNTEVELRLSKIERDILAGLTTEYKWISRSEKGYLVITSEKPYRDNFNLYGENYGCWSVDTGLSTSFAMYDHLFRFIRWKDEPFDIFSLIEKADAQREAQKAFMEYGIHKTITK